MMKRLSIATAAAAFALSACGTPADEFRDGVPREEMVKVNVPQKGTSALSFDQAQNELKGDHSGSYDLTRGATLIVNGGAVAVLGLVKAITDHQPTSLNGNTAVWGPHTDALSPNTWKLTVRRTGSNRSYAYTLEGKAKTADDSAYVVVLSGTHNASAAEGVGTGAFLLDWDKAATLPEHDANVGTAAFNYSRDGAGKVQVSTHFAQVKDGSTGNRIDADYAYASTPNQGGKFEFSTLKNINPDASTTNERLTIESRWLETGAGRSDVKVSGGDLGTASATASECWDANFNSQYLNVSYDASKNYGTESTDCAIVGAEFSSLH